MYKFFVFILVVFGFSSCADEEAQKVFTLKTSEESGIKFINKLEETLENNIINYQDFYSGGGVSIGDINNDGLPDVFFTGNMVENQLYLNKGELHFENITQSSKIKEGDYNWCTGSTMVDINNDGWLDIYVGYSGMVPEDQRRNRLWINQHNNTFINEAEKYGIDDPGYAVNANFFDYDKDGDLDMYLVNQGPEKNPFFNKTVSRDLPNEFCGDKLYRNENGVFTDVTLESGIYSALIGFGHGAAIGDVNNDGWDDIFVCNDFIEHDYLYINNQDGTFSESMKTSMKHISNYSMGNDIADFNNDGFLDIVVVDMIAEDHRRQKSMMSGMNAAIFWRAQQQGYHFQYMSNTLHRNNGNNTFSEIAHLAGVSSTDWSWGPLFADFDGDGFKDLFVANGLRKDIRNRDWAKNYNDQLGIYSSYELFPVELWNELLNTIPSEKIPNYIFMNNGDLTFDYVTRDWGLEQPSFSNGAAYGDLDNDGDLDLIVNNVDEEAFVYENNSNKWKDYNYIKINLKGSTNNPMALGSKVEIIMQSGGYMLQQHYLTRGYRSSVDPIMTFGCGRDSVIQEIIIEWPDNTFSRIENMKTNQELTISQLDEKIRMDNKSNEKFNFLFANDSTGSKLDYLHKENLFDPYLYQPLLPYRLSELGPFIDVADVNGDRLDDFYVGSAKGISGQLFIQNPDGSFIQKSDHFWSTERNYEDMGVLFFDVDNDGDQDLYVVSGGYELEANDDFYQDRLYINDGQGNFEKSNILPVISSSGGRVIAEDYDKDGDFDLFVTGRQLPHKFPMPTDSYILRNDGGSLVDVTNEIAPDLIGLGMVTDAVWTDYDLDGDIDFIVVGEWMRIMPFLNDKGHFIKSESGNGLEFSSGWWNCIVKGDFDNDGDEDFVAGNLGLNYRYKASREYPFNVYTTDFNGDQKQDIVLAHYENGVLYPVENLERSILQIPGLGDKLKSHDEYSRLSLEEIYGRDLIAEALNLKVHTFATSYIENKGYGNFEIHALPVESQISNTNDIIVNDFNDDGSSDILIAGNLHSSEEETVRVDAGIGLLLTNDGKGEFKPVPSFKSGLYLNGDIKDLSVIRIGDADFIIAARNGDSLLFQKVVVH